jgi:hypothetical protein
VAYVARFPTGDGPRSGGRGFGASHSRDLRRPTASDLFPAAGETSTSWATYQCYARVSDAHTGERLPAFSVQLDPPPNGDRQLAATLARLSAERYGRDALDVDLDLQGALERIRGPRRTADTEGTDAPTGPPEPAAPDIGTPASAAVVAGAEVPK